MISGELKFAAILFGLVKTLRFMARRHPSFARRLAERDMTAQFRTADNKVTRHFTLQGGKLSSARGLHPKPDI